MMTNKPMMTKTELLNKIEDAIQEGFDMLREADLGYSEDDFNSKREEIIIDCKNQIKTISTRKEQIKLIDRAFLRAAHYE